MCEWIDRKTMYSNQEFKEVHVYQIILQLSLHVMCKPALT